jgi:hypothetical protein
MSLLNGRRTTDLEATIPPAGGWIATGHLESGAALDVGPATLVMGDLTLVGAVLPSRGGQDSPDLPSFVVAGGAGWRTALPAPGGAYASPSGVRLRTVLADLARAAGETYDAPADVSIGAAYGWDAGTPADAVLAELVARGALKPWRVQPNGRTTFAPWPSIGAADARGQIIDSRLIRGVREVALTTSIAAWLPGATVQGTPIRRVTFKERADEIRALAWAA